MSDDNAPESAPANDAAKPVLRGGLVVLLVAVLSLLWYLLADRHTPYTSQARVQGYVLYRVGGPPLAPP